MTQETEQKKVSYTDVRQLKKEVAAQEYNKERSHKSLSQMTQEEFEAEIEKFLVEAERWNKLQAKEVELQKSYIKQNTDFKDACVNGAKNVLDNTKNDHLGWKAFAWGMQPILGIAGAVHNTVGKVGKFVAVVGTEIGGWGNQQPRDPRRLLDTLRQYEIDSYKPTITVPIKNGTSTTNLSMDIPNPQPFVTEYGHLNYAKYPYSKYPGLNYI